jgi:hypothetical protein
MMKTAMIMHHVVDDDYNLQGEGADGGDLPLVHEHGPGAQQHLRDGRVHRLAGGPQAALWPRPHRASRGRHIKLILKMAVVVLSPLFSHGVLKRYCDEKIKG